MDRTMQTFTVSSSERAFDAVRDQLWERLAGRRLHGYRFERTVRIGEHTVDFCCESARLLIDVHPSDGANPALLDERRVADLEAAGYLVLHLWEQDLRRGLEPMLDFIYQALSWREES